MITRLLVVLMLLVSLSVGVNASYASVTVDDGTSSTLEIIGDSDDDDIVIDVESQDSDGHFIVKISANGVAPTTTVDSVMAECTDETTYAACEMQSTWIYALSVTDDSGSNTLTLTGDSDLTDEINDYSLRLLSSEEDHIKVDLPTTCEGSVALNLVDDEDQDQKDGLTIKGGCNRALDIYLKDSSPDSYMVVKPGMTRSDISISKDSFRTDIGFILSPMLGSFPGP